MAHIMPSFHCCNEDHKDYKKVRPFMYVLDIRIDPGFRKNGVCTVQIYYDRMCIRMDRVLDDASISPRHRSSMDMQSY